MITAMPESRQTIFQIGIYFAELLPSKRRDDSGWYVIVQPQNSGEIVAIDRYPTYEAAKDAAIHALELMNEAGGEGLIA